MLAKVQDRPRDGSQGSHDHSESLSAWLVRPRRGDQAALVFFHGRIFGRKTGIGSS
jgi:hypothetical protein